MRLAASANNGINLLPANIKTKTDTTFGPKEKEIKYLFQSKVRIWVVKLYVRHNRILYDEAN